ncbi:amine dehydrogenase large subunit [Paracoccus sp. (in: a-proteobacteria)]|uniref:amine dehydrogenase large subunit n=1 Tax=Paracoccus sp. TaxID=267 RepID=UPI003A8A27C6
MKQHLVTSLTALALTCGIAKAQEGMIEPETLTVEERISEGGHVFVMDMGLNGPSSIYVMNAGDLSVEGNIGAGTFSQMRFSDDRRALFTASIYMSRFTYGNVEGVVHEWDPATLMARREFNVSEKTAQTLTQAGALNLSGDGTRLFVQNATPATSVNVVDLADPAVQTEVPTPGCWTAYPTRDGAAFVTLCGDGTIRKFTVAADGGVGAPAQSDKIFDPDADPLFGNAVRVGDELVYLSYAGTLYMVDDSGEVPVLTGKAAFAQDGWGPSGYGLMTYHAPSDMLFVTMHSGLADGTHKAPAEEIWAIDMGSREVVARGKANGESNIAVAGSQDPVLFGLSHHGSLHRYDVTPGDPVTIYETASREGVAAFPTLVATDF